MNKKIIINSLISSIGFVSFEGVFWKIGANVFDNIRLGESLKLRSVLITILAVICFAVFIYFIIMSVNKHGKEEK